MELLQSKRLMKKIRTRRSDNVQYSTSDQTDFGHNWHAEEKDVDVISDKITFKTIKFSYVFLLIFSSFSFLFDFGSDVYLMIIYYKQNNFNWFILTFTFVCLPSIIMTLFSLIWYWNDSELKFSYLGWVIRLGLHFIQLAPLVRYIDTLIYAWKSKYAKTHLEKFNFYRLMIYEEADSSLLRVIECSMESTPQLLLQLYIFFTQPKVQDISVSIIQIVSSVLSLISLSWCLTSYQSSLRLTTPGKKEMKIDAMILMVLWKLFVLHPRFLSISLFTSVFKLYILIVLGVHYTLMAIYIISQKTTFFSSHKFSFKEIIFNLVMAAIYCVDFLNLTEGHTRFRYLFFYGVSFVEISSLIILWYLYPPFNSQHLNVMSNMSTSYTNGSFHYQNWSIPVRKLALVETISCFVFGIILMIIYFLKCHPTGNIQVVSKKRIVRMGSVNKAGDRTFVHNDQNLSTLSTKTKSEASTLSGPNI